MANTTNSVTPMHKHSQSSTFSKLNPRAPPFQLLRSTVATISAIPMHKHSQPFTCSKLDPRAPPYHPTATITTLATTQSLIDANHNLIRIKYPQPPQLIYSSLGELYLVSGKRQPKPPPRPCVPECHKLTLPKGHPWALPISPSDLGVSLGGRRAKPSTRMIPRCYPSTLPITPFDLGVSFGGQLVKPVSPVIPKGHSLTWSDDAFEQYISPHQRYCWNMCCWELVSGRKPPVPPPKPLVPRCHTSTLPINPSDLGFSLSGPLTEPVRPLIPKGHSSTWSDQDYDQYISRHQRYCWDMGCWIDLVFGSSLTSAHQAELFLKSS